MIYTQENALYSVAIEIYKENGELKSRRLKDAQEINDEQKTLTRSKRDKDGIYEIYCDDIVKEVLPLKSITVLDIGIGSFKYIFVVEIDYEKQPPTA